MLDVENALKKCSLLDRKCKKMNENKKIAFNSIILFVRLCLVSGSSFVAARLVLQA